MKKNAKFKYIQVKGEINDKSKKREINAFLINYKFNFKDLIIVFLLITIIIFLVLYHNSLSSLLIKTKDNGKQLSLSSLLYTMNNESKKLLNITDNATDKKFSLSKEIIKIYSIMLEAMRNFNNIFNYNNNIKVHTFSIKKGVGICTIGRKENLYAKEFVEYYLKLGIKKIIIYDNNDINEEKFEDVLVEYIKNNSVEIIDVRGIISVQLPLYNLCYKKYGEQFDYISFLDFDEYITIKDNSNINDYIYKEKFNKCESIILNWKFFGDNDLEKYDNRTLKERFTKSKRTSKRGKNIVLTGIPNLLIISTLIIGINTNYFCDSNGRRIYPNNLMDFNPPYDPEAWVNHYYTKTVEEFCNKIEKGDVHYSKNHPQFLNILKNKVNRFIKFNKVTFDKLKKLEKCSGIKLDKYKNRIK